MNKTSQETEPTITALTHDELESRKRSYTVALLDQESLHLIHYQAELIHQIYVGH